MAIRLRREAPLVVGSWILLVVAGLITQWTWLYIIALVLLFGFLLRRADKAEEYLEKVALPKIEARRKEAERRNSVG